MPIIQEARTMTAVVFVPQLVAHRERNIAFRTWQNRGARRNPAVRDTNTIGKSAHEYG